MNSSTAHVCLFRRYIYIYLRFLEFGGDTEGAGDEAEGDDNRNEERENVWMVFHER